MAEAIAILGLLLAYLDARHEQLLQLVEQWIDSAEVFLDKFRKNKNGYGSGLRSGIFVTLLIIFLAVIYYFSSQIKKDYNYNPYISTRPLTETLLNALKVTSQADKYIADFKVLRSLSISDVEKQICGTNASDAMCAILVDHSHLHNAAKGAFGDIFIDLCAGYDCTRFDCKVRDNIAYVTDEGMSVRCEKGERIINPGIDFVGYLFLFGIAASMAQYASTLAIWFLCGVGIGLRFFNWFSRGHALKTIGLLMAMYGVMTL